MSIIRDGFQSADLDAPVITPTLNLDFANSQELDPRITFSRGSIGTFVNKNGLISIASTNEPRFDYDPISGECKGLLIEESSTNSFPSNNALSFYSTNTVSTGDTNPDGTAATLWVPNSLGNYHGLVPTTVNVDITSLAVGATIDVTVSLFAKNYRESDLRILMGFASYDGATYRYYLTVADPNTGTFVLNPSGIGWSLNILQVIPYPNGWYRFIISGKYTKVAGYNTIVWVNEQIFSRSSQQFWYGDNNSGVYIWGIQREQKAFPTSYIPTSGSTVTRNPELVEMTGTNFSSWFGSSSPSELSVFYSGLAPYASSNGAYYWQLTNTAITERIIFRYAGLPQVIPYINGLSMGGVFANASQVSNMKSVGLIDNKSFAIRVNDGNPDYQFTNSLKLPRIPTGFQQLNIGSSHNGFNYLNGTIRKLTFYPKRLSSSQAVYLVQ